MRIRLVVVLFTALAIPLIGIGWLGVSTHRSEQELAGHRREALLLQRLADLDGALTKLIQGYEARLSERIRAMPEDPQDIREQVAAERLTRQMFRLGPDGRLAFPAGADLSADERAFLSRTRRIWDTSAIFPPALEQPAGDAAEACRWFVWHIDEGLQLIYWCVVNGRIAGAEVDPAVAASDLIAALPDNGGTGARARADRGAGPGKGRPPLPGYRIQLVDVDGQVFYQWGSHEPSPGAAPDAALDLTPPLASFQLRYFSPGEPGSAVGSGALGLGLGFVALVLAVIGLGVYFVRESNRDARAARARMTFVNQVSHELKTPLTNLRMYAELLDDYLEEDDATGRRYVGVIVSESERLSRLIANVLSFARHSRGALAIRRTEAHPDRIIEETLERFTPGFAQAGIAVTRDLNAARAVALDGDALAQILGNLLSNVEKYAAQGGGVGVESRWDADTLFVTVRDRGEGIPAGREQAIFEPFFRLSNRLTDRAAGTGIGLSISRELARRHGGDLAVCPSDVGACFCITLNAPLIATKEKTP